LSNNLGKQVRSGFGWDLIGTFFKQISTLVVTVFLARLLTPDEFGVVAMAMVFVALSQVFVDVGFTQGLIQSEKNTDRAYSSVFFLNICFGFFIGLIVFISSPFIGDFYDSDEVSELTRWLCLIPIIGSFGNVHNAIFLRKLNFKVLAFRAVFSSLFGGALGVIAAYFDYGAYALVIQQITSALSFTVIIWWKSNWKPSLVFSYTEIKELMNFSSWVFFDTLLRRFFLQIDTLFIGKYFSPATLGFYSRASSLNKQVEQYTTSSLRKVIFPAFSRLQNNPEAFKKSYYMVFRISSFLGAFLSGFLFFLSEDIIIGLLGEKWRPSVIIFQILVFRLTLAPFGGIIGKSLLAKGFSKEKFILGQIRRVFLLTPIYFGYNYGIEAFTLAIVFAQFFTFLISIAAISKYIKYSFSKQFFAFLNPLLPLLLLILFYLYYDLKINSFVLSGLFVVFLFTYAYFTKNKGLIILKEQIQIILKKN